MSGGLMSCDVRSSGRTQ